MYLDLLAAQKHTRAQAGRRTYADTRRVMTRRPVDPKESGSGVDRSRAAAATAVHHRCLPGGAR